MKSFPVLSSSFQNALKSAGSSLCYQTWAQRLYNTLTQQHSLIGYACRVLCWALHRLGPREPRFQMAGPNQDHHVMFFAFFFFF